MADVEIVPDVIPIAPEIMLQVNLEKKIKLIVHRMDAGKNVLKHLTF
jgi:hypothetical protein